MIGINLTWLDAFQTREWIERIGWLLIHSLWQFAILALVACILNRILQRHTASTRYLTFTMLLTATLVLPLATFFALPTAPTTQNNLLSRLQSSDPRTSQSPTKPLDSIKNNTTTRTPADEPTVSIANINPFVGTVSKSKSTTREYIDSQLRNFAQTMQPWLPLVVFAWGIGVFLCSMRPIVSWLTIRRLLTVGVSKVDDSILARLFKLKQLFQVGSRVTILQSTLVHSPVVIGVLQSVILLPIALVATLPPAQLEAILAHELAHVKRFDFIINLLQTIIETLFFYHPGVWWISHRIRVEREHCCDDLVVAKYGNRADYGRALLAIEEQRGLVSTLALGARDGSLLARVQRIAGLQTNRNPSRGNGVATLLLASFLFLGIALILGNGLQAIGEDQAIEFGNESNGIQFRLVPLSPTAKDDSPDLKSIIRSYKQSNDLTFGVELKNVSREPITLVGLRYGDSYAPETQGLSNATLLAPYWFNFEFTDQTGKPISRAHREFYNGWHIADNSSVHTLAPGESLIEVLRPAKFISPMDHELAAGKYQVRVRYHGPDETMFEKIREHWPDKKILNAWTHQVESNTLNFSIEENSRRPKPEDLEWGREVEGLEAAIEFRVPDDTKGNPAKEPGVPVGTPINVIFHLRNVSDQPISFVSETGRQGDHVFVTDEGGKIVEIKDAFYTGWPIDIAWELLPGEIAQLNLLTPNISSIKEPGVYFVRYTIRFNSRSQKDEEGNVIFPRPGDFDKVIDTGTSPLFLTEVSDDESPDPKEEKPKVKEDTEKAKTTEPKLPWRARGLVLDANGKPMAGVTVRAATGVGSLLGGGSGLTDENGNYDFRFGPGVTFQSKDTDKPHPQTQFALISANLDGYFEQNFCRQGNGIASLEPIEAADLQTWNVSADQVCLPNKPREVDFIMLPAARVSGTLIGEDDQPLQDYSVSLTGKELAPGTSVLAQVVTDQQGRFEIHSIPTTIPYQFVVRKPRSQLGPPWDDSWASGAITFNDPKDHQFASQVAVDHKNLASLFSKSFQLKIVGPAIEGSKALARAIHRDPLIHVDKEKLDRTSLSLDNLVLTLTNKELGCVVSVDKGGKIVFINLGKNDGVIDGMEFTVLDADTARHKCRIKIKKVFDTSSQCQVIDNPVNIPAIDGDSVYSPLLDNSP